MKKLIFLTAIIILVSCKKLENERRYICNLQKVRTELNKNDAVSYCSDTTKWTNFPKLKKSEVIGYEGNNSFIVNETGTFINSITITQTCKCEKL